MIINYVLSFVFSILLCVCLTPLAKIVALKLNIVDKPNQRKVHARVMPYLGGVAIFLSFSLIYGLMVLISKFVFPNMGVVATNIGYALLVGGGIVVLTGVIDDKFDIPARYKLLGQLLAALVAVYFGLKVEYIHVPFVDHPIYLGALGIPITIVWIVGVSNAINLIDGLDGLASGVSAIAAFALCVVSFMLGNHMTALILLVLIGSLIGFLFFNFHPAKIFMGDSGALFLGYALSIVSLMELKAVTVVSFIVPILILGVPISDTMYAMIRRKLNKMPISAPDKNHMHHRLIEMGLSHRNAVLTIYLISFVSALFAIFLTKTPLWVTFVSICVYILFFEILAEYIGMMNNRHRPILSLVAKLKPSKR